MIPFVLAVLASGLVGCSGEAEEALFRGKNLWFVIFWPLYFMRIAFKPHYSTRIIFNFN